MRSHVSDRVRGRISIILSRQHLAQQEMLLLGRRRASRKEAPHQLDGLFRRVNAHDPHRIADVGRLLRTFRRIDNTHRLQSEREHVLRGRHEHPQPDLARPTWERPELDMVLLLARMSAEVKETRNRRRRRRPASRPAGRPPWPSGPAPPPSSPHRTAPSPNPRPGVCGRRRPAATRPAVASRRSARGTLAERHRARPSCHHDEMTHIQGNETRHRKQSPSRELR